MAWWCHMLAHFLVNFGSGNGLAPVICQAIIWTNNDLALVWFDSLRKNTNLNWSKKNKYLPWIKLFLKYCFLTLDLFIQRAKIYRLKYMRLDYLYISMVSCQKGPTRHAYAWHIGPFWQDAFDMYNVFMIIKSSLQVFDTHQTQFTTGHSPCRIF